MRVTLEERLIYLFRSRRNAVLLVCYLVGLIVSVLNIKLAISIGVVACMMWMFDYDEVSYKRNSLKTKRGN